MLPKANAVHFSEFLLEKIVFENTNLATLRSFRLE